MPVDLATVRRIAHLAHIAISDAEAPASARRAQRDPHLRRGAGARSTSTGVEPMTSVIPMKLPMREDVVTDGEIEPQVLANAPLAEDGFFVVPKVVE